jgi:hypothetical protein
MRIPRLALALALALLVPPVGAQWYEFSPRGSGVGGSFTFLIDWQGKPALLIVGQGGETIARYTAQLQAPVSTPIFTLVAAWFQDTRPCAVQPWSMNSESGPTSQVSMDIADIEHVRSFGFLAPDGTLLWMPPAGQRIAYDGWRWFAPKTYEIGNYLRAMETTVRSACPPEASANPRVQVFALVLTFDGMSI